MAKADKVSQMISSCGIVKISESNNVVYVKLLAELRLGNSALLANVVIPFARSATLASPCGSIIAAIVATAPHSMG